MTTMQSSAGLARQQAATITAAANHTAGLFEQDAANLERATTRLRKAGEDLAFHLDEGARLLAELVAHVGLAAGAALASLEGVLIDVQVEEADYDHRLEELRQDPECGSRRDEVIARNLASLNGAEAAAPPPGYVSNQASLDNFFADDGVVRRAETPEEAAQADQELLDAAADFGQGMAASPPVTTAEARAIFDATDRAELMKAARAEEVAAKPSPNGKGRKKRKPA